MSLLYHESLVWLQLGDSCNCRQNPVYQKRSAKQTFPHILQNRPLYSHNSSFRITAISELRTYAIDVPGVCNSDCELFVLYILASGLSVSCKSILNLPKLFKLVPKFPDHCESATEHSACCQLVLEISVLFKILPEFAPQQFLFAVILSRSWAYLYISILELSHSPIERVHPPIFTSPKDWVHDPNFPQNFTLSPRFCGQISFLFYFFWEI